LIAFSLPAFASEITIVGTGSGMSVLSAIGEAFTQETGVTVNVPASIGSGGGIKAVGRDEAVIGRVAREIKESEQEYGLTYTPVLKLPIVFFVNPSVTVDNLTAQQVTDIYAGKITNWSEVGGHDAKIKVVRREEGDSSLEVLREQFPGFGDLTITDRSKTTYKDSETIEVVEQTADTIAFGAYSNTLGKNVGVLKIDGVNPADSAYPYGGVLALIYKQANKTGDIAKFVEFATSAAAHDAITKAGATPIK